MEYMCEELTDEDLPGLEAFLTSDVILDLLKMPKDGLIRINAALFFLGSDEMFAFYWREQNGKEHCKLLEASAVRAAFHEMPFDSGILPPGLLRFGIDETGTRWFSIFRAPCHHSLSITGDEFGAFDVPLPGLIFTGRGASYWIWATKDTEITPQTALYHAPLPNVETSGRICFGANRPPEANGSTMSIALRVFLESPFNGHMANNKSRKHPGDIRYLLQELASMSVFPYDDLLPITTREHRALTFDVLLKHVIHPRR